MEYREMNQCINAARDLLRQDNPVVSDVVEVLIKRAFALGEQRQKDLLVDAISK